MSRLRPLLFALLIMTAPAPARAAEPERPLPRRAFLGAQLSPLTPEARARAGLSPADSGVAVTRVLPASTAERARLEAGDVIVAFDGHSVGQAQQVVQAVARHHAGDPLTLTWRHARRTLRRTLRFEPPPLEHGEGWDVEYGAVVCRSGRLRTIWTRPRTPGRHPALFLIQGIGTFSVETPVLGVDGYGSIIRDFARRGFVTLRVDKPGCGDSEGGPLRDLDFDTQLDAFRQALARLRADPAVDPERILIFGHSMGGVWGPLLAAETPVRGIAVYGTLARTWEEYVLENTRRQAALAGRRPAEIDSLVRLEAAAWHALDDEGLSPAAMAEREPRLRAWVDSSMTAGVYYSGCHVSFFRQLAGKNLARAWEGFPGQVLALYGRSDFLSGEEDHALIARIVNQAHPGHARFAALDGVDHAFRAEATQAASFATWGTPGAELDPRVVESLRAWSEEVVGTTP